MSRATRAIVYAVVSLCALRGVTQAAPPARSVSTSRQFIVYGPDARLRGAICDLAERTRQIALTLLQEKDAWRTPIVVNARYPEANLPELPPTQLSVGQTGWGLKLQLDLEIGTEVNTPAVERELLRAIFLEMMYRAEPNTPAGTPYVQPPDWLLEGALALAPGRDSSTLAESLGTFVASGNIISLEEFLRQQPSLLESALRAVYRAYSAALVSMLTEVPEGRARLTRFVADLPQAGNDPLADLKAHFPALGENADKMQKTWTLSVARLSATERFRLLNCEGTERRLAQLLRVELRASNQPMTVYSLEEFPGFIREPAASSALQGLTQQLLLLSGRANPLYRPIIAEYGEIAVLLARGKTKRMTERLAKVRATREHITRRMSAIGDYMNWFEATQARSASGAFREYLQAAELALEPAPRRRDRISVYLDALESQFQD